VPVVPEVLVVNATGRNHPRRAGLAFHLGAVLGLPTVGVTTRPLVAEGVWPVGQRAATASLRLWARWWAAGADPGGGQAGGGPCRLADRRPGGGLGGAARDPPYPEPRAPAPRLHTRPNPAGAQPLNAVMRAGLLFDYLVDVAFNYPSPAEAYRVVALDAANKLRAVAGLD
jgi:hypothetical protein